MELISCYQCSQVPVGHPTGLQWRLTSPLGEGLYARARARIDAVLRPYEAHHSPTFG